MTKSSAKAATLYHYKNCSTCKRAKTALAGRKVAFDVVDLVDTPPSIAVLRDLWQRSGLPLKRFFNTSGESYRAGGFSEKLKTLDDDGALQALAHDGKLIKRPILDTGIAVLVGLDEDAYAAL